MMLNLRLIENGYLRIGVIAHSDAKQKELLEAFRGLNFQAVIPIDTFAEAKEEIAKGRLQWIFSTIKDKKDESIEPFLDQVYQNLNMIPVVFSVVVGMNEMRHLPHLFSKGLFTWHPDKGVAEYTRQSLWRLKRKIAQVHGLGPLIPYLFLRSYLKEKNQWREMVTLCESMINHFPYEDVIKVHLVEAYLCVGNQRKAQDLLRDMEYFEASLANQIHELKKSVLKDGNRPARTLAERYRLSKALIVHSNIAQRQMLEGIIRSYGFRQIDTCSDGDQAWELINKQKTDILILDWDCEGISAANLLQRIRLTGLWDFPILVEASQLKPNEAQLVKQYGVAACIPNVNNQLMQEMAISWTIVQSREPTEAQGIERKIVERLGKRDVPRAKRYFQKYLRVASRDPGKEKLLLAQIELVQGNYLDAKYLLMEARNEPKINVVKVDTMMAQCMFALDDFAGASNLLKRIKKHAVNMIELDSLLARSYLRLGDISAAMKVMNEAAKIDGEHPWVLRTIAKIFILNEDLDKLRTLSSKLKMERLIKDCVNLAIAYVNSDALIQKGINLLRTCLDLADSYAEELRNIVELNLALAYISVQKFDLAKTHWEQVNRLPAKFGEIYQNIGDQIQAKKDHMLGVDYIYFDPHAEFYDSQIEEGQSERSSLINDETGALKEADILFLRGIFEDKQAA